MRGLLRRATRSRLLLAILAIGVALRVLSLVIQSRLPLEPDAVNTLELARASTPLSHGRPASANPAGSAWSRHGRRRSATARLRCGR